MDLARRLPNLVPVVALSIAALAGLRCGSDTPVSDFDAGNPLPDAAGDVVEGPDSSVFNGPYSDLPSTPIVGSGLPGDIGQQFGDPDAGGGGAGPCISEPATDAMIPRNWTPLFAEWAAPAPANVFEIRIKVDNQISTLVAYQSTPTFTLDGKIWGGLAQHSAGHDATISVRSAQLTGSKLVGSPSSPTSTTVHLAPVDAPGSVVYWSASGGTAFRGFTVGALTSKSVLTPTTAGTTSTGGPTTCISCHTSSPDGKLIFYTRDTNAGPARAIDVRTVVGAAVPDAQSVSPAALALLGRDHQAAPLLNAVHYTAQDAVALSVFYSPTLTAGRGELAWTNLHAADATGWGLLTRTGDPRQVSSPAWRRDGTAVAYVSSATSGEGVIGDVTAQDGAMDIYTVPYNNHQGGVATPLPGASDPSLHEFYPVYSPNDVLLAFNRTSQPVNTYSQPSTELAVVPGNGGTATRLRANDPPACTGLVSPGITNSWPRWAPTASVSNDKTYYWVVFSSKRRASTGLIPQLYVAAVVTQVQNGQEKLLAEYPAVYVLSQDATQNNHTPAWDNFEVSQIPN